MAAGLLTAVPSQLAVAAPSPAAAQPQEQPPDEAADLPSAKATARVHNRRVEALSERTESSSTWVNPDGTRTSEVSGAPVRVRRGDAWLPVDLTLSRGEDGVVRSAAHPRGLELAAGGGDENEAQDLAVARFGDGATVALQWQGLLPEPVLDGPTATYPEVRPGVDLVVQATRVGFEQRLTVKRPLSAAMEVELPLRLDRVEARTDEHGNTELVTAAGESVGAIPAPTMWDARIDERSGGPAEVRPVPHQVEQGRGTGPVLRLTVGAEYFDDPARQYPVTVDPTVTVGTSFDTFTQSDITNTDQSGMTELRLGTYDGGTTVARSYLHFDMTPFRGADVYASTLWLYQFHADSCTQTGWQVWSTPLVGTGTRWANQPAPWSQFASPTETRRTGCTLSPDWTGVNIKALAQAWSDQQFGMAGVMLKAVDESSSAGWKKFYSAESGAVPHIDITYNLRPNPATGLNLSDRGDHSGVTYTRTTTPTLSYSPTDADGDQLWPTFYVYEGDTLITARTVGPVPSGAVATWQVPPGILQAGRTYRYRASAHDGQTWGGDGYVAIRNKLGGRAVTVENCLTDAGTQMVLWDYWGGNCQRWNMTTDNGGYWAFGGRGSGRVPNVQNCGTADGTLVNLWDYGGTGNHCQLFQFQPGGGDGEYKVISRHSGKPLDPLGCTGANGSHLGIWTAYLSDCQVWRVELAPDPGVTVQWLNFTVDTTAPGAPLVTSTDYPNDNAWHRGAGQAGDFTFTPPAGTTDTAAFVWGLDVTPTTEIAATTATTVPITPSTDGAHVLNVRTKDKAGNLSAITAYAFQVGRAGLVQPADGTRAVNRVKLQVEGESAFTHVTFVWRRGPGAAVEADIPAGNLTKADGSPLSSGFVPINGSGGLGGFAVWNAADTMGPTGGVVQVKAVLATDGAGTGAYSTVWRTVTIDPNAAGAAGTQVGPGGVNLLTGDYTVSVTDVEEFGLEVSRTSSSRDTRAGYQFQRERLTVNQQKVSTDTAGFAPVTSSISRSVDRGHDSTDSLAVTAPAAGPWGDDTHAAIEADLGALRLGMQAGRTYRLTAWIYVPAATGLSPPDARGLKVVGFVKTPAGYQESQSIRPWTTDAWQQLVVDLAVPPDATEAFFRLYNGFAVGSGKTVYFDDLSLKEVVTPFGPSWETGVSAASAGIDYKGLTFPHPDEVQVDLAGGGSIWFTRAADGRYWPEPGAEALALTFDGTVYRLAELDGTVTVFGKPTGAETYVVQTVTPPVAAATTRYSYELVADQLRVKRVIAPTEPGVGDCLAATPARGCEALDYDYASTTTASGSVFGDYARQVRSIGVWSTDPATGVVSRIDVATYRYDDLGRLREVWDPRLSPPLKTTYAYDSDGRVTSLTPAGELPWQFDFGSAGTGDPNAGRLLKVRRAALLPGTLDQLDGEIASTVVYNVPLTRPAGGPHDLDAAAIATWAQQDAPTDATALFGPEDPVAVHTATSSTPGQDGYSAATVHYLNATGQTVNVATPGGHIDTTEYDRFGNVVRSLESANRALALGQGTNAAQHLAELGLAQADSATRATWLDSRSTVSADGLDVLETLGPLHRIALANDPTQFVNARSHTVNTYDEGKPDGANYHLVTRVQTGAQVVGLTGDQELRISTSEYTPVIGGTSGWTIKQPTRVTVGVEPGTTPLATVIRYDDQGRARESRKVDATGTDAGTTLSTFYTAGAHPEDAACGNRPEWAGQPCTTQAAGSITGHDPARMASELPVKRVEAYSRFGEASRTVETVAGQSRTTVVTHDAADRITNTEITGTLGTAVPATITEYDATTGDATITRFPTGGSVQRQFDKLGRLTRYTDADGAWTASTFDRYGKPATVTDSLGTTQTFTYNRTLEPRGFLTSVTDSIAGTMTASYGPDGQITGMDLPGDVRLTVTLDPAGAPTQRAYTRVSNGALIASSAAVHNVHGQAVQHAGPASTKTFAYDTFGRLTRTADTSAATGVCTVRSYAFDRRTNRTGKTTRTGTSGGTCPADTDPPTSTESSTYDSADRLTTAGHTYDAFGRITAGPGGISNSFFVNDLVREQTLGTDRKIWTLDPEQRLRTFESQQFVNGAWASAITKVNHYGDDSDEPRWIAEDTTLPSNVTRLVSSPEGDLAITTGLTGGVELQLTSLQGSVMATAPVSGGVLGAVTVLDADEYGIPSTDTPAAATKRYAWLGGKQRSAEALGGVILMGARLYHPGSGRFWSVDSQPGGNASAYEYCHGDPVNCTDLDGRFPSFSRMVGAVAQGAEYAAWIPGPIGTSAAAISAGAYAATGNYRKAAEMTVVAAANLVGAGAAVKVGMKAATMARGAGKAAATSAKSSRASAALSRAKTPIDWSKQAGHLRGHSDYLNRLATKKGENGAFRFGRKWSVFHTRVAHAFGTPKKGQDHVRKLRFPYHIGRGRNGNRMYVVRTSVNKTGVHGAPWVD